MRVVIEEHDASLAARNFALRHLFAHAPQQIAAVLIEIGRGHLDFHHLAVECLGTVLQCGIGDDNANTPHIQFGIAERLEKAGARLRHHAQQLRVVEMAAVIHVAQVQRDVG